MEPHRSLSALPQPARGRGEWRTAAGASLASLGREVALGDDGRATGEVLEGDGRLAGDRVDTTWVYCPLEEEASECTTKRHHLPSSSWKARRNPSSCGGQAGSAPQ